MGRTIQSSSPSRIGISTIQHTQCTITNNHGREKLESGRSNSGTECTKSFVVECQVSYTSGRILKRNVKWTKKLRIPEHVDKNTIEAHFSEKLLNIRAKLL